MKLQLRCSVFAVVLSLVLTDISAFAAPQAGGERRRFANRETRSDPYMPYRPPTDRASRSPAMLVRRGIFTSVQVNVDAQGNNIVGDAANEPSIAIDPTNPDRIVIAWRQFDTIASDFRQAGVGYSHDRGQTWTASTLDPGVFRSDPVLAAAASGTIYFASLFLPTPETNAVSLFRTIDGGQTWSSPVYAFGGDKEWMVVDRSGGPGNGNIYLTWSAGVNGCCGPNDFTRSFDHGANFQNPIALSDPKPADGTMDVGPNGELFFVGANGDTGDGSLVFVHSPDPWNSDLSPSFDAPRTLNIGGIFTLMDGPNGGGLLGQPWIAVDRTNQRTRGFIYVLASLSRGSDPLDVMFIRSMDGGSTWSQPLRVNDDAHGNQAWQWFGTMSVAPNGRIDAVWNDTRNDPGGYVSEVFYSYSLNAGYTWSPNVAVTPAFDPLIGYPQQNKIGDYCHMISDAGGANLAFAATFNGEQDVYFLRIPQDCNHNGIEDDCEVECGAPGTRCDVPGCGLKADCNGNLVPDECEPVEDCNNNSIPDICELAVGVGNDCNFNWRMDACETDCNGNGIPDNCDVENGFSIDCNEDLIPDECQLAPDCNGNGIPDACDALANDDCNQDGIPDECEANTAVCGNGIRECFGAEQCDGDDGPCPGHCKSDCTCENIRIYMALGVSGSGTIRRSSLVTPQPRVLLYSSDVLSGIAIDSGCGLMYWGNEENKLFVAGPDGLNPAMFLQGAAFPTAIEVARPLGRIYWAGEAGTNNILRAKLDGGHVETIVSLSGSGGMRMKSLALDLESHQMFWARTNCPGTCDLGMIQKADLDGSATQTIFQVGGSHPKTVAVDSLSHKLYWRETRPCRIRRADLDGAHIEDLYSCGEEQNFAAFAIDSVARRIYWSEQVPGSSVIMRGDYDGSEPVLLLSGLPAEGPRNIALDLPSLPEPSPSTVNSCYSGSTSISRPCSTNSACGPNNQCSLEPRYVGFQRCDISGAMVSIQVKVISMPQSPGRVGEIWWAGAEHTIANAPAIPMTGAPLVCDQSPLAVHSFSGKDLYLYGAAIVSGATYEIRTCDAAGMNCSAPMLAGAGRWGDVVAPFGEVGQPNISDIAAVVDKFRQVATAADTPRADLVGPIGGVPDQKIDITDVSSAVDAFRGVPFPYAIPACP